MAQLHLEKLFGQCVRTSAAKYTSRHLIGFRGKSSFNQLIQYLERKGIKPIKTLRSSRVICCYMNTRSLNNKARITSLPSGIKFIEKDARVRTHALRGSQRSSVKRRDNNAAGNCPDHATWNICRVQAPDAWAKTEGDEVRVAVIDTGIAKHANIDIAGGVNTTNSKSSYYDDNGHGTHVAGIIAAAGKNGLQPGVAPKVSLYAIKALDHEGLGYISDIIEGINWCIRNKIQVINMSFGLLPGEQSAALQEAIQKAYNNGIVCVASAGNSGTSNGRIDEPASFSETISVAASNRNDQIASYSSRGDGIDITAPGTNIRSLMPGSGYVEMSGTSMSCPHVAGGAALLLATDNSLTPDQVSEKLKSWAKSLSGYNVQAQGSGLMQLASLAAESAVQPSEPLVNRRKKRIYNPRHNTRKPRSKTAPLVKTSRVTHTPRSRASQSRKTSINKTLLKKA
ncbi:minor extracellular protease Epr [Paenibacillus cellulosilyticus]|uniref:Minor extracellular protease Epr n=1 Tax=Paenibacillus cellulosilyticus TaxID=375489 RepID=A0A2V2YW85_9BACL|nr:S8 family peptidase [Paenibacillus cellulosilyticus]PWW05626.1 minor extracellular protease Epr [Paenibacillus cellulosilyticus]QKS45345.1 S8 family peptidase [Paenibacillus cellulosilyticus]